MIAKATGCKGSYALMRLPNHDRLLQTMPDATKDFMEKIVYLITLSLLISVLFVPNV